MKDLKVLTLRGGVAKIVAQGGIFALRIGSVMILARLLDPKDFGLVGMVTVVTGAFSLFKDAGLSVVTVQRPTITDEQISTLFWLNMLVGGTLAAITIALAPALVNFYREPRLFWVAVALGSGFVVNAAGVQHGALLQRQMRFVVTATTEIVAWVVSIAVGVGLASTGFGYWSLVWMALTLPAVSTAGAWLTTGWIPGRPRRGIGALSMIRFGSTVTLNTLTVYAAYNADKLLIGRLWGAAALGMYGRAYQLINIPTENLNSAVGGIAVSALARVQNDAARFKSYFLKSYTLVLAFTLPVTLACALFADDIIIVLLGRKWAAAAPIFRLMAPTILSFAMLNPLGWLLFASGHVVRSLKMAFVIAPIVILGYVAGLPYGAPGVALGYSAMMALLTVPMILWAIHGTVITRRDVLRAVSPPFVSAMTGSLFSAGVALTLGKELTPLIRLTLCTGVLAVTYLFTLLVVMRQQRFYINLLRDSRNAVIGAPSQVAAN
jgi:O-antigen/teichoic acid export membrane protein